MKKTIPFHPLATVEQRKAAINEAMASDMPFRFKQVLINMNGLDTEYTGGFTQMLLAKTFTIIYSKPKPYATL